MLFTDVVGSTELAARIGDRQWREVLAMYRGMVRRTLKRTGGHEVDDAGDGFFAVFDHPADAIACACLLSDEVRTEGLEVRSGIHMGEAETAGPKPGGIAVHIGARVCAKAGAGEVLVSATVRDVVRGSEYGFVDLGEQALKGVPGEMRLFKVTWESTPQLHASPPDRRRYALFGVPVIAVVVAVALVLVLAHPSSGGGTAAAGPGIVTVVGTGVSGDGADGAAATKTAIAHPIALALDSNDLLYFVTGNQVRRANANGTVMTVAGTGVAGDTGDGGAAVSAELDGPQSIGIDSLGDLVIADSLNNRIREVSPVGIITTIAGNGHAGFSGDGADPMTAELNDPKGVAIGLGNTILIADSGNNRIRLIAPGINARAEITTLAGTEDAGYADGATPTSAQFNDPQCLADDAEGNVYIADALNDRVREISTGGVVSTVVGSSVESFSGDKGPGREATIQLAKGPGSGGGCLSVDGEGDLFIADAVNNRIRELAVNQTITTVVGNGRTGLVDEGGPATSAPLGMPLGVVVDPAGRIFVADTDGNRICLVG